MAYLRPPQRTSECEYHDPRRRFLARALGFSAAAVGGLWLGGCATSNEGAGARTAQRGQGWPRRFGPGPSVFRYRGRVRVDGQPVATDTAIPANATIETGANSELIFAVGPDAFLVRSNTRLELAPRAGSKGGGGGALGAEDVVDDVVSGLRAVTGQVMSSFGARESEDIVTAETPTATVGIRGTGLYLEAGSEQSYVCTCYGKTRVQPKNQPDRAERIESTHHDARYVRTGGATGERVEKAPLENHEDPELVLIDALVGRKPPFASNS